MIMSRYKITNTIKDGTKICGYRLTDANGNTAVKEKGEVEKLTLAGYIDNAMARIDKDGIITMKGRGCKLRELPVIKLNDKQVRITHIVTAIYSRNRRTVGYSLLSSTGIKTNVSVEQAVEMARAGLIVGVGVQKFGENDYRLRGKDGFSLEKLPVLKVNSK